MVSYDFRRADWGAKAPKGTTKLTWSKVRYVIVHYPGTTTTLGTDMAKIKSALRGWQNYHMTGRGWRDIAYSVGVDQAGRVWELRGTEVTEGATAGLGGVSVSILAIYGNNETPSAAMKAKLRQVALELKGRGASSCKVTWHQYHSNTSCPGAKLISWLKSGMPVSSSGGAVTPGGSGVPAFPLPAGYYFGPQHPTDNKFSVSGVYGRSFAGAADHVWLKLWQDEAKAQGLFSGTARGVYDDPTREAALRVQARAKVAQDGLIGRDTWPALWTSKPKEEAKPEAKPDRVDFRFASYNLEGQRFGGGDYKLDARFIKEELRPSLLAVQEADEKARTAIRAGTNLTGVWATNMIAMLWDPAKWNHEGSIEVKLATGIHGLIGKIFAHKSGGKRFVAASAHVRPSGAMSASLSDAQVRAEKLKDVAKFVAALKPYENVVVGIDQNTKYAQAAFLEAGFVQASPDVDTMTNPGDQRMDAIYVRGSALVDRSGGKAIPPVLSDGKVTSDHFGLVGNLSIKG